MLALFYSYSLLQLVQEALPSRRITIAIARPGGILSLSNFIDSRRPLLYRGASALLIEYQDLVIRLGVFEKLEKNNVKTVSFNADVLPLYAIAIDPRNLNVFAVVGSDQYAHLYDIDQSELLVSYRGNSVYLFTRDMGLGNNPVPSSQSSTCSEANGKATPQVYKGHGKKRMWMV
ncbi:hypothetical protein V6N13_063848 [Hibiscus sabdariffa]